MEWPRNIKTLTTDELKAWLRDVNEKQYRADQIQKWLFCQQEVTITLGVTRFDPKLGASRSIQTADKALYEGKDSGRNKVIIWDPSRTTEEDYRAAAIELAEEQKANKRSKNGLQK